MKRVVCLLAVLIAFPSLGYAEDSLVVYSARKEHLIKPIFEMYQAHTGTKIKYITDKAGPLLEKLKAEGDTTEADLLMTVDAGNLWHAASEGILDPVISAVLDKNVPTHLKDPGNRWFGLSVRARTIVYNPEKVSPEDLSTYEDLVGELWKGRLCLRTSKKVYNQSLVAMMIEEHGEEKTEEIIKGWVANLAAPVFSNDTKTMEAIAAGQCDVGIVNTYYFGRLKRKQPEIPLALYWPNQDAAGVHVNVSGVGIIKHSRHKESALRFLEWLSTPDAQRMFADANLEYPVNPSVPAHAEVSSWGTFKQNVINVSKAGELQTDAVKLMDRAGYR